MQIARRQQQGSVPIDNPPSRVAKERAIRIAVECNPQIKGALTLGNGLGHCAGLVIVAQPFHHNRDKMGCPFRVVGDCLGQVAPTRDLKII